MAISVVVADDHPVVVGGLQLLLGAEPDFRIAASCTGSEQALAAVRQYRPNILVIDLRMPGRPPLDVVRALEREKLPTRAILLTASIEEHDVLCAIRAGVRGIILKEMAPRLLLQCIRKVSRGGTWLETGSMERAVQRLAGRAGGVDGWSPLTDREQDVLQLVARGMRNRDIAESLNISVGTVKVHIYNIFRKVQVASRVELTLYARTRGLT